MILSYNEFEPTRNPIKTFSGFVSESYNYYTPNLDDSNSFSPYNSIILGTEDLFQLDESNVMPKFTLKDFGSIFRAPLMESNGYVSQTLLEKAHAYYELAVLGKTKRSWLESEGEVYGFSSGDHRVLVKNNEAFVISESTLAMINEASFWTDATNAFASIVKDTKSFVRGVVDVASTGIQSAWKSVTEAAKEAFDLAKSIGNAAVKFVSDMNLLEAISLVCGISGAVLGALGPVFPGIGIFAGAALLLGGGLHLLEGKHKADEAYKKLSGITSISPFAKVSSTIASAVPDAILGSLYLSLGIHDIVNAATAIINPLAGASAVGVKITAKSSASILEKGIIKSLTTPGHSIEKLISKAIEKVAPKIAGKAATKIGELLVIVLGEICTASIVDFLMLKLLKLGGKLAEGIDSLVSLPGKISDGIREMSRNAKSVVGKIITKALENIITPTTELIRRFVEKYIKPTTAAVKEWFDKQIKSYEEARKVLKEMENEHAEIKSLTGGVKIKEELKPVVDPTKKIKGAGTAEDEKNLKKVDLDIDRFRKENPGGYRDATAIKNNTGEREKFEDYKRSLVEAGYGRKPAGWKSRLKERYKTWGKSKDVEFANSEGVLVPSGPNSERVYLNNRYFQFPKGGFDKNRKSWTKKGSWKFVASKNVPGGLETQEKPDA